MGNLFNRLKKNIDKFYYFFYKNKILTINHNNQKIKLINNSPINFYRIKSFSNKEPMTLKWIDTFEKIQFFLILEQILVFTVFMLLKVEIQLFIVLKPLSIILELFI